jgi:hypothetical protein
MIDATRAQVLAFHRDTTEGRNHSLGGERRRQEDDVQQQGGDNDRRPSTPVAWRKREYHSDREEGHEARNPGSPFADEGDQEGRAIGGRGDMQPAIPATPTTRSATDATFLFIA